MAARLNNTSCVWDYEYTAWDSAKGEAPTSRPENARES